MLKVIRTRGLVDRASAL